MTPSTFPSFSPIADPTSAPTDAGGGGGAARIEPNGRGSASTGSDSGSSELTVILVVVIIVVVLLSVGLGTLLYVNRLTAGSNKREVLAFSNPHCELNFGQSAQLYFDIYVFNN